MKNACDEIANNVMRNIRESQSWHIFWNVTQGSPLFPVSMPTVSSWLGGGADWRIENVVSLPITPEPDRDNY